MQEQLENTPRQNIEIFKMICEDIKDRIPDFQRSLQECRARIQRLKTMYFQTKRTNNKSGGKRRSKNRCYLGQCNCLYKPSVNASVYFSSIAIDLVKTNVNGKRSKIDRSIFTLM